MSNLVGMKAPIFRGKVVKGKISLDLRERFKTYLCSLEGKRVELILRERQSGRSDDQNRYYHGVVVKMLSDHTGYSPEEMHDTLKERFRVKTTTKLSVAEFQDYIARIVRWAADDLELPIPDPDQVDYL
jgi:hypothetical protein